jgi:hypothetical protein
MATNGIDSNDIALSQMMAERPFVSVRPAWHLLALDGPLPLTDKCGRRRAALARKGVGRLRI